MEEKRAPAIHSADDGGSSPKTVAHPPLTTGESPGGGGFGNHPPSSSKAPSCPVKILVFTVNLLVGLVVSQLIPTWLSGDDLHLWTEAVQCLTMFTLCYIMINVGYEFDIDKTRLGSYGTDYLIGACIVIIHSFIVHSLHPVCTKGGLLQQHTRLLVGQR